MLTTIVAPATSRSSTRDLLRGGDAPEGALRANTLSLGAAQQGIGHVGLDEARGDHVEEDAVRRECLGQVLAHGIQAGLARTVSRGLGLPAEGSARGARDQRHLSREFHLSPSSCFANPRRPFVARRRIVPLVAGPSRRRQPKAETPVSATSWSSSTVPPLTPIAPHNLAFASQRDAASEDDDPAAVRC